MPWAWTSETNARLSKTKLSRWFTIHMPGSRHQQQIILVASVGSPQGSYQLILTKGSLWRLCRCFSKLNPQRSVIKAVRKSFFHFHIHVSLRESFSLSQPSPLPRSRQNFHSLHILQKRFLLFSSEPSSLRGRPWWMDRGTSQYHRQYAS